MAVRPGALRAADTAAEAEAQQSAELGRVLQHAPGGGAAGGGTVAYQRVPDRQDEEGRAGGDPSQAAGEVVEDRAREERVTAVGRSDADPSPAGIGETQALLASDRAVSEEVRLEVTAAAKELGQRGVSVPGCCPIELGSTELVLECMDFVHLNVWRAAEVAAPGGVEASVDGKSPLCTIAKAGHIISSFLKLQGRDCLVTGGEAGEVQLPELSGRARVSAG